MLPGLGQASCCLRGGPVGKHIPSFWYGLCHMLNAYGSYERQTPSLFFIVTKCSKIRVRAVS